MLDGCQLAGTGFAVDHDLARPGCQLAGTGLLTFASGLRDGLRDLDSLVGLHM